MCVWTPWRTACSTHRNPWSPPAQWSTCDSGSSPQVSFHSIIPSPSSVMLLTESELSTWVAWLSCPFCYLIVFVDYLLSKFDIYQYRKILLDHPVHVHCYLIGYFDVCWVMGSPVWISVISVLIIWSASYCELSVYCMYVSDLQVLTRLWPSRPTQDTTRKIRWSSMLQPSRGASSGQGHLHVTIKLNKKMYH